MDPLEFLSGFSRRTLAAGLELAEASRFQIARDADLAFRVQFESTNGEPERNVVLGARGNDYAAQCDCGQPGRIPHCAHVVAAAVVAEPHGWGSTGFDGDYWADDEDEDDDDEDEDDALVEFLRDSLSPGGRHAPLSWRELLPRLEDQRRRVQPPHWSPGLVGDGQLVYVLQEGTPDTDAALRVVLRERRATGGAQRLRTSQIVDDKKAVRRLAGPDDAVILRGLAGRRTTQNDDYGWGYGHRRSRAGERATFEVNAAEARELLPELARSGRAYWREVEDEACLRWDGDGNWTPRAEIASDEDGTLALVAFLERSAERHSMFGAVLILRGLVVVDATVMTLTEDTDYSWLAQLASERIAGVPADDHDDFLAALLAMDPPPPLALPEGWSRDTRAPQPRVVVQRESAPSGSRKKPRLLCTLFFDYGDGIEVAATDGNPVAGRPSPRHIIDRDFNAERQHVQRLLEFARRTRDDDTLEGLTVTPARLPELVATLTRAGWSAEAEGKIYRSGTAAGFSVSSGTDWFEVRGGFDFAGEHVPLPRLLRELRRGSNLVRLDDGSVGVLPERWLEQSGRWFSLADGASTGDAGDDEAGAGEAGKPGKANRTVVRFPHSQAWILDALLAQQENVETDAGFERYRERLRCFDGIQPRRERRSFGGELRDYQREALGWLEFLREFGFGGCLADDMGLGKTVQVLAHLEELRVSRRAEGAHLVVAPRSVVGNWVREAARFAPRLKVIDYSGNNRAALREDMNSGCLVVTSYGTMRRDIRYLREQRFDVIVLDEAQAIKNPGSQTAKASRLLVGHQRLALTGTPIENHVGELWSLFEFLNPGMLGRASRFRGLIDACHASRGTATSARGNGSDGRGETDNNADRTDPTLELMTAALRPFVFRRTKDQVLTELPAKTEQTIICELDEGQRQLYDELREHYRASLLASVAERGLGRTKIQVLEALLRLRQAACHPGLLDAARADESSAKLAVLLEQLAELKREGHKALVFSQFTRFLGIVRTALDREGITYEYLDGRTRDREARVDHFQEDPECTVFLISLKAGGLGLNLTAADYVFILDPWWNPATEAQAIDRTHRIGQKRPVFAYRLICRDTVEEKIVALQEEKRGLADLVIRADEGLMRSLTADDLAALLG